MTFGAIDIRTARLTETRFADDHARAGTVTAAGAAQAGRAGRFARDSAVRFQLARAKRFAVEGDLTRVELATFAVEAGARQRAADIVDRRGGACTGTAGNVACGAQVRADAGATHAVHALSRRVALGTGRARGTQ
jgi:hypothetical protein